MTHVGERMKLLNCVSQDIKALAKILASAPRAVSKYRANVPDHLSGHCKMAAGSGLGTSSHSSPGACRWEGLASQTSDLRVRGRGARSVFVMTSRLNGGIFGLGTRLQINGLLYMLRK